VKLEAQVMAVLWASNRPLTAADVNDRVGAAMPRWWSMRSPTTASSARCTTSSTVPTLWPSCASGTLC
jgi:hypothetical protein